MSKQYGPAGTIQSSLTPGTSVIVLRYTVISCFLGKEDCTIQIPLEYASIRQVRLYPHSNKLCISIYSYNDTTLINDPPGVPNTTITVNEITELKFANIIFTLCIRPSGFPDRTYQLAKQVDTNPTTRGTSSKPRQKGLSCTGDSKQRT